MAEHTRPPVAIRIVRPYQGEDEFLENELETVGKTSVILIGAHSRPTGVILRFEVTLATGATILRGEGRVLAHKENAFRGQPGLSLRFTRLDPRSKALVDRAAAIREAKSAGDPAPMSARPSAPPPGPSAPASSRPSAPSPGPLAPASSRPDASIADALTAETPRPSRPARARSARPSGPQRPPMAQSIPAQPPAVVKRSDPPPEAPEAPPDLPPEPHVGLPHPPPPPPVAAAPAPRAPGDARSVQRPANRDDLLARLRERAASLPPDRLERIRART